MPKVFLPTLPSRFDRDTGLWVPTVNIDPARKFGEPVVLLPPEATRLRDSPQMLTAIRAKMLNYKPEDYVCCLGDPGLIAFVAITAARMTGGDVRLLRFDRMANEYIVLHHQP